MAKRKRSVVKVPSILAASAITAVLVLSFLQPEPTSAEVVQVRPNPSLGSIATVQYLGPDGTTHTADIVLPMWIDPRQGDVITVWPDDGENPTRYGKPFIVITPVFLFAVAGIAFLLGLVVEFSMAGYGYVRTGQMSGEDVKESRGFYWRT